MPTSTVAVPPVTFPTTVTRYEPAGRSASPVFAASVTARRRRPCPPASAPEFTLGSPPQPLRIAEATRTIIANEFVRVMTPPSGRNGLFTPVWSRARKCRDRRPGQTSRPPVSGTMRSMADVERTVAECALAIPGARIDPGAFADYLRSRVAESDAESALAGVHARDLFAAFGCLRGDAACLRWFEKTVLSRVPDFVARIGASAAFADEVKQQVREELLVDGPNRPAGLTG